MIRVHEIGVILSARPFSEHARIVTFFNKSHGKISAILKQSSVSAQTGDICDIFWRGRSLDNIGTVKIETVFSPLCRIFQNSSKIFAIDSACAMCANGFLFAAPHEKLFDSLINFISSVPNDNWIINYVFFEMSLLSEAGYGLDLSKCVVTGSKENLSYVSPKTGGAVTKSVGWKYRERLFPLPDFMISDSENVIPNNYDIYCALNITGHFLKSYFYGINGKELPLSRNYLTDEIKLKCNSEM